MYLTARAISLFLSADSCHGYSMLKHPLGHTDPCSLGLVHIFSCLCVHRLDPARLRLLEFDAFFQRLSDLAVFISIGQMYICLFVALYTYHTFLAKFKNKISAIYSDGTRFRNYNHYLHKYLSF